MVEKKGTVCVTCGTGFIGPWLAGHEASLIMVGNQFLLFRKQTHTTHTHTQMKIFEIEFIK